MRQPRRRVRWLARLGLVLGLLVLAGNALAWTQAWRMTHYVAAGQAPHLTTMTLPEKIAAVFTGFAIPRPENRLTPQAVGLTYTTTLIPLPGTPDALEAWYVPAPQPRGLVLLCPPYIAAKESLLAPAKAFHDLGYDTLLLDYRGVGGSPGSDTTLGVREASDVATAAAYARRAWPNRPLILYGMSMGAAAVLRAVAVEGVRPAAIVVEAPFDRLLHAVEHRLDLLGLPDFPTAEALLFWGSVQQGFDGFAHNPAEYAAHITCPTLVMRGARDPEVSAADAAAVYDQLAGPRRFVEVPGAGHELLILAAPDLWRQQVGDFLSTAGTVP